MWKLAEACAGIGGRLQGADVPFAGVTTDSRGDCRGQLFVALRGTRFDGHDYVAAAAAGGPGSGAARTSAWRRPAPPAQSPLARRSRSSAAATQTS